MFIQSNKQLGATLVEFVIALPILLIISFLSIEISLLLIQRADIDFAAYQALEEIDKYSIDCTDDDDEQIFEDYLNDIIVQESSPLPANAVIITKESVVYDTINHRILSYISNEYLQLEVTLNLHCMSCSFPVLNAFNLNSFNKKYIKPLTFDQCL